MNEHFIVPLVSAIVAALVPAILAQLGLIGGKDGEKPSTKRLVWLRSGAVLLGTGVFGFIYWGDKLKTSTEKVSLESVEALPNPATVHGPVGVVVHLNKPAPTGGASVYVASSDKRALALDGNVTVPEGSMMSTNYYEIAAEPANALPIVIQAVYDEKVRRTDLNVAGPSTKVSPQASREPGTWRGSAKTDVAPPNLKRSEGPTPVLTIAKPSPLSAELISRLEEAQGQFTAEEEYWQNVRQHMPPGTSLRPEISSQISAAKSAVQRCDKDRDGSDAALLTSCIDALNDHLTQLKIQH